MDFAEIMTLLPASGDEHEHEDGEEHAEEEHSESAHAEQEHADDEHDHGTFDTHTWLNITEMPLVIDAIARTVL